MQSNKKGNLIFQAKLMGIILVPLTFLLVSVLCVSITKTKSSSRELYNEKLNAIVITMNTLLSELDKGDWELKDGHMYKGKTLITNQMLDNIKSEDNIEITLFYNDTREVTTLLNEKNERILGTKADSKVIEKVLKNKETYTSESIDIQGKEYFCIYKPLLNNDGTPAGMLFIGQDRENIRQAILSINEYLFYVGVAIFIIACIGATIVSRPIGKSIQKLEQEINKMSQGDLNIKCMVSKLNKNDSLGSLAESANNLSNKLSSIVTNIKAHSDSLLDTCDTLENIANLNITSLDDIAQAVDDIAKGAEEQANNMSDTMGSVSELSESLDSIASKIDALSQLAVELKEFTESTNVIMEELKESNIDTKESVHNTALQLDETLNDTKEIANILESINGIAEQTNLLSLNASIEAARAGEAGKGFAVVAGEVKVLATTCKEASQQISTIVNKLNSQMSKSSQLMNEVEELTDKQVTNFESANDSVLQVIKGITTLSEHTEYITNDIKTINKDKELIESNTESLSAISEENAASTEETSASSMEMTNSIKQLGDIAETIHNMSRDLKDEVDIFKTKEETE